jgi:hypothetical protein
MEPLWRPKMSQFGETNRRKYLGLFSVTSFLDGRKVAGEVVQFPTATDRLPAECRTARSFCLGSANWFNGNSSDNLHSHVRATFRHRRTGQKRCWMNSWSGRRMRVGEFQQSDRKGAYKRRSARVSASKRGLRGKHCGLNAGACGAQRAREAMKGKQGYRTTGARLIGRGQNEHRGLSAGGIRTGTAG